MATCHSLTRLEGKISGDPLDINMFEATQWVLDEPGSEKTRYDTLAPTVVYPPGEACDLENINENTKVGLISIPSIDIETPPSPIYIVGYITRLQSCIHSLKPRKKRILSAG